ncbi:sodium:calcium antiporter [Nitratireductor mangrovi]|uniref:Sodium:calcium antiporter n=1 Tax=Nitratireductor mangrovi TaxID=2599600 RepID=A0A5B8KUI4_9HYPH|nr:sodium:calcium antiporter [Nitratireductor mangrovi]QDY99275.1 sodium:calcium antiporter [Nitratireductor mangrovi]
MPSFAGFPVWLNVVAFAVSAGAVWIAGTRLSYYVDAISRHTGLGQAVLGVFLLGGITSLPEIAVAGTASFGGNAPLAVNNLLGGFSMQVAVLAVADLAMRQHALTFAVPNPIVLLQGALGILLVALVCFGIAVGDIAILGAGAWTWGVFALFLFAIRLIARSERQPSWQVVGQPPGPEIGQTETAAEHSLRHAVIGTAVAAAVILCAGYVLSESGEALAEQTGLGSSFFGAVFVAISTSLPEVSTVLAAVRLRRYVMAVSDIFGTNLFDLAVIFLVDLFYFGGPVLNEVGQFSIVAGLIGILVTGLYLVGLIERRNPLVFGIGLDTIAVVVTYLGGIGFLYTLR